MNKVLKLIIAITVMAFSGHGLSYAYAASEKGQREAAQHRVGEGTRKVDALIRDIDHLEEFCRVDTGFRTMREAMTAEGAKMMRAPLLSYKLTGVRLETVYAAMKRILYLSYLYNATDSIPYAERAREEILNICNFPDWNPRHYIDTAELLIAVSTGLNWLDGYLSDEDKKVICKAIVDKGLARANEDPLPNIFSRDNNWNSICNAGVVAGCSAIRNYDPGLAKRLLERSVEGNKRILAVYEPDGGYPEGNAYAGFGSIYQTILFDGLKNYFNDIEVGQGISSFCKVGRFLKYMTGPLGLPFNFGDGSVDASAVFPLLWIAARTGDGSLLYDVDISSVGTTRLLPIILYYAYLCKDIPTAVPDKKTAFFDGLIPIFVYRGGWTSTDDEYLGIKGGKAAANHGHADVGSFVYDADGVRWALDLGQQDYYSMESRGLDIWNDRQDSDRWKILMMRNDYHNTLTLNGKTHNVEGRAPLKVLQDDKRGFKVEADLTEVLPDARSAVRTFRKRYGDSLTITDRIRMKESGGEVEWTMITEAVPTILEGNRIRLMQDGKECVVRFDSDIPLELYVQEVKPLHDYEKIAPGRKKVGFRATIPDRGTHEFKTTLTTPSNLSN